ncbi:MAG: hypothetical protein DRP11_02735 [Candidatus Aenigmatarchaeota archaeon]|nr:MAG: hypothetical protein DRP11_02735 [Candidatus Aenigmarchaeota archaeon]
MRPISSAFFLILTVSVFFADNTDVELAFTSVKDLLPAELREADSALMREMFTSIESSLLKHHRILVFHPYLKNPKGIGLSLGPYAVIITSDAGTATLIGPHNFLDAFNEMMRKEDLIVDSYDVAVEVAHLFMRICFQYIVKQEPVFFATELRDTLILPDSVYSSIFNVNQIIKTEIETLKIKVSGSLRSEFLRCGFLEPHMISNLHILRHHFRNRLKKAKFDVMVMRKGDVYTVETVYTYLIHGWEPYYGWKVWKIVVALNGEISTEVPKEFNRGEDWIESIFCALRERVKTWRVQGSR